MRARDIFEWKTEDGVYYLDTIYDYFPASRGSAERGTGIPLTPNEPARADILSVKLLDGAYPNHAIPGWSDSDYDTLEQMIIEHEESRL